MEFSVVKELLAENISSLMTGYANPFQIVSDNEWSGNCPAHTEPTPHLTDNSKVCMGCHKIHLVESQCSSSTLKTVYESAKFIVDNYKRQKVL